LASLSSLPEPMMPPASGSPLTMSFIVIAAVLLLATKPANSVSLQYSRDESRGSNCRVKVLICAARSRAFDWGR
jgi:hypothetical protein